MRRLIAYLNHLFLGVILGMIFVAILHSCPVSYTHLTLPTILLV